MTRATHILTLVLALTCSIAACTPAPKPTNLEPRPATPSELVTSAPEPGTKEPIPTAPTGSPIVLKAYFDHDEKMQPVARTVPYTTAVLKASIEQLLKGPTAAEAKAGIDTQIPKSTKLRGVTLAEGIATVDLSEQFASGGGTLAMTNRLAQVVYTATQFKSVDAVVFEIEGKRVEVFGGEGILLEGPQTRGDYEYSTPAILVDTPAWSGSVHRPLTAAGTANVFEAAFRLQVLGAGGQVLLDTPVKASSGTGTRGTWSVVNAKALPLGAARLRVFSASAKDGSPTNVVEVPITITR